MSDATTGNLIDMAILRNPSQMDQPQTLCSANAVSATLIGGSTQPHYDLALIEVHARIRGCMSIQLSHFRAQQKASAFQSQLRSPLIQGAFLHVCPTPRD